MRYIDADWLYEKVENRYRVSSGIEHRCERDLLDLICDAPTADVAPKSEVDGLRAEIKVLTENSITAKYPICVSCGNGVFLTKSLEEYDKLIGDISAATKEEVAMEIFEEIEASIAVHAYTSKSEDCADGMYDAIEWVDSKIAELKKKYTEGKT